MYKQSPSRNLRSKGIKVKHVLQICVLLAVCFWLIYQVKRSHDKKKAFDESNVQSSLKAHVHDEILKFGRKGLHPRFEETTVKNEKHDEVPVEEDETGGEEEEYKQHEEEEQEDNKAEDKEDEGRGGGDDEIDENDQDKSEIEIDREEDFLDEEKEREEGDEKEVEDKDVEDNKEGQNENESSVGDHNHDGVIRNAHEAREEHYRGDDASSAVTHKIEAVSAETETGNLENSNTDTNFLEGENKVNDTEEISSSQNTTASKAGDIEMAENGIPLNVSGKEENNEIVSSKMEESTVLNSTITAESNNQSELGNNSAEVKSETNNLVLQNGTETKPDSTEAQNATGWGTTSEVSNLQAAALGQENSSYAASNNDQSNSNFTISSNNDNAEAATGGLTNSSTASESAISENIRASSESVEVEGRSGLTTEGNTNVTQDEKSDASNGTGEVDETSDSFPKIENADEVRHDPIDSSDSSISLNERDGGMNLDALPEIITEGSNNEVAAE